MPESVSRGSASVHAVHASKAERMRATATPAVPGLLLLAPSQDLGGGIERVADAIESGWSGPVARVNLYSSRPRAGAVRRSGRKPVFAIEAACMARRLKPKIVLALHVGLLPAAVPAARISAASPALMVYGREAWAPFGLWERLLIRRCQRVISISCFTADWFAAMSGFGRSQISVVNVPLQDNLARQLLGHDASALRLRRISGRLVTVCRLAPEVRYKGYLAVAECLPEVFREFPDAEWIVAGDGPDRVVLADRCRELGISDHVHLLGRVSDQGLIDLYLSAYAFIMPSEARAGVRVARGEGLGLVYLEAAAAAVPSIISLNGGGSVEFVEPNVAGLAVSANDVAALTRAVARLLREPSLRDALGEEARRRVLTNHRASQFRKELERVLLAR
jgi:glycosyltransferase involved in cell wall biosynthesis